MSKDKRLKNNEDEILSDVLEYIAGTYSEHYSSANGIQLFDLFLSNANDGEAYLKFNIIKYAYRLGKKGGESEKKDLYKIIHYAVILLKHLDDK